MQVKANSVDPYQDTHCLPLPIYKPILNKCQQIFAAEGLSIDTFFACILTLKGLITAKSSGFIGC